MNEVIYNNMVNFINTNYPTRENFSRMYSRGRRSTPEFMSKWIELDPRNVYEDDQERTWRDNI